MIKLIIEKELRDIIGSTKFAVTFGVCAVLIVLTFYVGAKNHQLHVARYEAARAENFRKMEGLTDWLRVNDHRIFLPPQPLESLVTGVANDIGRTIEMRGRGELNAVDSRFNDDPIFAVFRFLDLNFIFTIVLSLFAILLAFDAISGEKERGTLRLSFSHSVPRDHYILAKVAGSFLALSIPLLIPILLGSLLLPVLHVYLTGEEWIRLGLIFLVGLLYFGVFLTLSIFVSALTKKSSNAFLALLVIWIAAVFIVPRSAVLLAGRAVPVTSVDQLASQKSRYRAQLWKEDQDQLASYKPKQDGDPQTVMNEFNSFMQKLADERTTKLQALTNRLNEERRNMQVQQERLAFGLARVSPSALFSLAASTLAGTAIDLKQNFLAEANGYQGAFAHFMKEKTGLNLGGDVILFRVNDDGEDEQEKAIDPRELPEFAYHKTPLPEVLNASMLDVGLLMLFNILFFAGAFVAFLRYDVR